MVPQKIKKRKRTLVMQSPSRSASAVAVFSWALQFAIVTWQFALPAVIAAQKDNSSLAIREEAALTAAAEKVAPSVVQIRTIGGFDVVEGTIMADGPTTGLVISPDGYILSSAFNFAQKPTSILVTFASGKQAPAELVATDHSRMIVLLKATGVADLPVPAIAPGNEIHAGQWAVALGRTFRADRTNVTVGIVSAVNRMFGKAIQTDADVSTTNYGGPLVDVQGRVLGLIVPMAPQATSEVAGVEWYDSGIGFAVPLAAIASRIEQMKAGKDLRTGLLGIGMQPQNSHVAPAELAVVRPGSPAGKAGLKKGDRITEVNGKPIANQNDLRFALGTLYGGDTVRIIAKRGDDRIERSIALIGELPAFRHAFLGVLPMRTQAEAKAESAVKAAGGDGGEPHKDAAPSKKTDKDTQPPNAAADAEPKDKPAAGVIVRMVYSDSPAADAGLKRGDRITELGETKVSSIAEAIDAANNFEIDSKVIVKVLRDGKPVSMTLTTTQLPTNVPLNLPAAFAEPTGKEAKALPEGTTSDFKLPEFQHACRIYVPSASESGRIYGVVLWLEGKAEAKPDDTIRKWQTICDRDGLLFVVPTPKDADHWERTDLEYLHRLLMQVKAKYRLDPRRVVVGGTGNTGAITWPLALASRSLVRGIVSIAAPLPRQIKVPTNDPANRFSIFAAIPPKKEVAATMNQGLKSVVDAGYNVTTITTNDITGNLNELNLDEIARWVDSLDRF